jgi:hypothetical protein
MSEARAKWVGFRVDDSEHGNLERDAAAVGLSVSDYLRTLAGLDPARKGKPGPRRKNRAPE